MMKETRIKLFTVIGLVTVVLLQASWLYNTYNLIKENIEEKSNALLLDASERELFSRFMAIASSIPEGTLLAFNEINYTGESTSKIANLRNFQEALLEYSSKISLADLDSIYSELLKEEGINAESVIRIVTENDSIIESSKDLNLPWFGTIENRKLPIRADNTQFIEAIIVNPYRIIFQQMGLLLIATVIMAVFVVSCITYQIQIIMKQNRIARIREDFSNAMIHDMKSPITSIIMSNRILQCGGLKDDQARIDKHFSIIHDESQHLLALTNKVLTIAKLEQDKIEIIKQTIEIRPVIEDLIEKFEAKATKSVTFVTQYETEKVHAEYEYLKEAISNLIDNAIKYSNESVEIRITCTQEKKQTIIKIRDNGFGIDIKDQTKIFEKFERAEALGKSRKGGATGFGLGLNYVQRVIRAHGGEVYLDSVKDQFTEFTINMPILIEEI
ncbi:MAG: HAMP domain-containing histidine kinase [Mediterranea sp.]|jgi:two-component system phosphate regulon sensor histidine kinase PhoR|nr:HAMP domain-containing histidine kinase [Mediterranea sp.]